MRPFPVWLRWFNTLLILAVLVAGPLCYYLYRDKTTRRFHVVEPGVLYRSGQLPVAAVQRIHHDYGIRTIISLREGDQEDDREEEAYCHQKGIQHVRIAPLAWHSKTGGPAPAPAYHPRTPSTSTGRNSGAESLRFILASRADTVPRRSAAGTLPVP